MATSNGRAREGQSWIKGEGGVTLWLATQQLLARQGKVKKGEEESRRRRSGRGVSPTGPTLPRSFLILWSPGQTAMSHAQTEAKHDSKSEINSRSNSLLFLFSSYSFVYPTSPSFDPLHFSSFFFYFIIQTVDFHNFFSILFYHFLSLASSHANRARCSSIFPNYSLDRCRLTKLTRKSLCTISAKSLPRTLNFISFEISSVWVLEFVSSLPDSAWIFKIYLSHAISIGTKCHFISRGT